MNDQAFVVTHEYGFEGSEVLAVQLTFDAATAAATALAEADRSYPNLGGYYFMLISEWFGTERRRTWVYDSTGWVEGSL